MPVKSKPQPQVVLAPMVAGLPIPKEYGGTAHFRLIHCAEHHFTGPWPCDCPQGPQELAWFSTADEIFMGGTRGSAKTELLLAWMAFKGNTDKIFEAQKAGKEPRQADLMYIADPNYRGLLMRNQANDMADLIDRAEALWGPTGCEITRGNPSVARWPRSGATIVFGHFGDNGWKKYIGPQYQRIGFDQAEQLPSKEVHDRIVGSCRSKWSQLRCQVMLTANPGGGDEEDGAPGQAWLMEYFRVEWYLRTKPNPNTIIKYPDGKTLHFIPSSYKDNPYLLHHVEWSQEGTIANYRHNDGPYVKWLNSIEPESLRRAWRDGDWAALSGQYFRDFRPHGPLAGEEKQYPNARHVYDPAVTRVEPWWHAWASLDWGYIHPSAFYAYHKSPFGQVFVDNEIVLNRVEPFELGVLLARELKPILAGLESRHINLYTSPDAYFKKESENTAAHQLAAGIRKELGPASCFLADLTDAEREMSSVEALESMKRRRREQRETQITLLKASTDRVAGWMHMQTMLRFRPLHGTSSPDMEFANRLYEEKGLVAYHEYMNQPEFREAGEVLPKWQISNQCGNLIRCLPALMHAPGTNDVAKVDATENRAGDDTADSCFAADTVIQTQDGPRCVDSIAVGDMVWTREGLKPVEAWSMREAPTTMTVTLSNGRSLTGTPEHPIWVKTLGFKPLSSIRPGDILESWSRWSHLTESRISDTLIPLPLTTENILYQCEMEATTFIARSGNSTKGLFQRVSRFITRIGIPAITTSKIWSYCRSRSIARCMALNAIDKTVPRWRLPIAFGRARKLELSTTVKSASGYGRRALSPLKQFVKSAESLLFPAINTALAGVPGNALSAIDGDSGSMLSPRNAQCVQRTLALRTTPQHVPLSVLSVCEGPAKQVFNLQIKDCPEYFANGVLVHNCRYGLFSEAKQGSGTEPLDIRIDRRMQKLEESAPGLSAHSIIMARERMRELESTKGKQQSKFYGHNRLAVARGLRSKPAPTYAGR